MAVPKIRGTQIGLRDPVLIDRLKADMLAGEYAFDEARGKIGGLIDERSTYHVVDGHHRMAAALELFEATGNDSFVTALISLGNWSLVSRAPVDSRPFPSRSRWGAFRNWLGI